jgi:hypothetical protein
MSSDYLTGYRIELENRQEIAESSIDAVMLSSGELPERVDPRTSPLAKDGWLKVEDQSAMGSCQGNALSETLEYCWGLATKRVIQLSRCFAYIASQMEDNIKGDSGSTLSGGTKAAKKGICLESIAPYPTHYPGWGYITEEMNKGRADFRLNSSTVINSADQTRAYIGSLIGIVQIGVAWNSSMTPDSRGCITRWSSANAGGHSVCLAGYVPDADVGVKTSRGWWLLLKNSWGQRWGVNGYSYLHPDVADSMLTHQWTTFLGRSDMTIPGPRNIDWIQENVFA